MSTADKRYDLDFKTPNNSGAEIKSGEEMIEIYKSFCQGIATLAYN
jgi:enolase